MVFGNEGEPENKRSFQGDEALTANFISFFCFCQQTFLETGFAPEPLD